ncbi:DNA (cytosine-5-)-methyltransferase [Pontiellaceae bacterium B12219]|nr:DNA (cytosine-5-)-methyltransferase [Pontiellaceae bacterium B12219]
MNFKLGELFSGPGGMALGAKLAAREYAEEHGCKMPIEHVWGVDMDPNARNTYDKNLPGTGVCIDANAFVEDLDGNELTISSFDKISGLAFGFPCNDFSLVGEQKGFQGKFGNLYKAGIKAIEHSDPLFFVAENVSGIHSANSDAAFHKIIRDLENAGQGYTVTTHLYKFEEYGVPQARHRYLIVGIRKDQGLQFKVPSSEPYQKVDVTCATALKNIPDGISGSEVTAQSDKVVWRLRFTPPGENAWKLDDVVTWENERLKAYLKTIPWYASEIAPLGRIDVIRKKIEWCRLHVNTGSKMSHIYKRLIADKPSYTITGSGGGGTHVYHWKEPRALTNRERARLQSFPDDFVFYGKKEQVRKQIGMAVPPMGAKIIFKAILDTFAGNEYPSLTTPSYVPMDEVKFRQFRFKRYKERIKTRMRREFNFDLTELNALEENISLWMDQDISVDDVETEILENRLLKLTPKG